MREMCAKTCVAENSRKMNKNRALGTLRQHLTIHKVQRHIIIITVIAILLLTCLLENAVR